MPRFRTAILGCGGIANSHARALCSLPNVQLAAFCDIIPERAHDFSGRYAGGKGAVYADYHDMFEKEALDVVYICLPPFAHTVEVEVAAKIGVHVFIEKPIALDMDTADRMVKAVRRGKVKSQVGFLLRFGEASQAVRAMVDSGESGRAGLFVGKYFCNSPHTPWWRDKSKSGGQIVEQIIHVYDLARFFFGEVDSVYCGMDNLFHKRMADYTVEDVSACLMQFRNGAVGTIAATNGAIPGQWLSGGEMVFQNRTVYFHNANSATVHKTDTPSGSTVQISSQKDMAVAEAVDFLEAIQSDREAGIPMSEGAKTLELVLAARKSGETGKVVRLGQ